MGYSFDGATKRINLTGGTTSFAAQDMYSRWKDWMVADPLNTGYLEAFRVVGGDPTTGSNQVASYYFLTNGWRIKPDEADHQLLVDGSLVVDGGGNPYVPTTGSFNVQVIAEVPVKAETVQVTESGLTAAGIADAVWDEALTGHTTAGSFGNFVQKLLTVAKFFGGK